MNILVCISNVPDTTSKINFVKNDTEFDKLVKRQIKNTRRKLNLTK